MLDFAYYFVLESDLREQVEGSLNMPPTYETVKARAQLAQVSRSRVSVGKLILHLF